MPFLFGIYSFLQYETHEHERNKIICAYCRDSK